MEGHSFSVFQGFDFLHEPVSVLSTILVHDLQHLQDLVKFILMSWGGRSSLWLFTNFFTESEEVTFDVLPPFLGFLAVTVNDFFNHIFVSLELISQSGLQFFLQNIEVMFQRGRSITAWLFEAQGRDGLEDLFFIFKSYLINLTLKFSQGGGQGAQ